jgi:hypothetical protein
MLNLDETLSINSNYLIQKDLILKSICYFFGVFFFLEYIRSQVSEVNLLQLVPGFYLLLFFLSFIILVFSSDFLSNVAKGGEVKKEVGTKTLTKLKYIIKVLKPGEIINDFYANIKYYLKSISIEVRYL